MTPAKLTHLLEELAAGRRTVAEVTHKLRQLPFEDLDFARVDHHRELRCGFPEVIFCPGKTSEQVVKIAERMNKAGSTVLATRANEEQISKLKRRFRGCRVEKAGRAVVIGKTPPAAGGRVAVVTAGTSDIPVAEEARITAELMGVKVTPIYDAGVAGLHRILAERKELADSDAVVVVAGMEGALASVVGGLASCPVIACPSSIGYGASFGGVAALLSMLNSCAPNVATVNIDDGFGAGYTAGLIARGKRS